nr:CrcB family protein [Luteimonas salinisoli]
MCVLGGGAVGGVLRHLATEWIDRRGGGAFPWGTLGVNASGAFAAGCLLAALEAAPAHARLLWLCLGIGLLGSYTTVSALALQTLLLARGGARARAAAYLLASLGAGLATVAGGYWLVAG